MSVAIPVVAVVFGSVLPPQGDILELRVHLGCTKEVSSFSCLLQNFNNKYGPGGTYPINVGDNGSISIGRGVNCPLILTLRVEEIEPQSTPVENYIRVHGRCWGEKIFRRVVTKTYENQKGEAIVKDLIDNYVGLSHVRDSTELIEDTDTTYTLLEYENTPVFDILKYIAESADKDGVIGFDFRVEYDGKFAFFPKNSKTSPISLSEKIENSRYSKDIHRVRNKITVYGAAEKARPSDKDAWTETLTHDDGSWGSAVGWGNVSLDDTEQIVGTYCIKWTSTGPAEYGGMTFLLNAGHEINCNKDPSMTFQIKEESTFNGTVQIQLEDTHSPTRIVRKWIKIDNNKKSSLQQFAVGKKHSDEWTHSVFNEGDFDWEHVKRVKFYADFPGTGTGSFWVDNLFFNKRRWEATQEDSSSQSDLTSDAASGQKDVVVVDASIFNVGDFVWIKDDNASEYNVVSTVNTVTNTLTMVNNLANTYTVAANGKVWIDPRELTETDEELHSDHECELRAKALLDHLSQPAESITVRSTCLDYGTNRLLPGDKIPVVLPNENINSDYRIISVEYYVTARDQAFEITLELGKEKPLLADYLYGLRSGTVTLERLARTKAGVR